MKKRTRIVLAVLLGLVLAAVIGIGAFGGRVIKTSVNVLGPAVLGVPVSLQDATFYPLRGRVRLQGLHVGNPDGFKTESLFDAGLVDVQVDLRSLLSDTIVIRKILVDAPQITFEQGLKNSNLGALMDRLGGDGEKADKPAPPATPVADAKPGKKVIIDELTIAGGKVKLSVTAALGLSAPIALAEVRLKNIGREGGTAGIGATDAVRFVLAAVLKSVLAAVGGVGGLALDGFKAIGGGAKEVGAAAAESLKALGGDQAAAGFKAMGDGAAQVGGAAVEGVKSIGSSVGKAVGDLFSGDDKTNSPAAAPQAPQSP